MGHSVHTMFSVLLHSSQETGHSVHTPCSLCCFTAASKWDTLSTHHVLCAASRQSGNRTLCLHTMFSVLLHSSQETEHSLYTPGSLCCFTAVRKQDTLSTHHVLCAASQQSGNGTFSLHTFSVLFHSSQEPGHSLYIPCSLCCFPAASKWDTLSTHHVLCAASQQPANGALSLHTRFSVLLPSSQETGHSLYTPCSLCSLPSASKWDTHSLSFLNNVFCLKWGERHLGR